MANLIITIIAIALVAAAALMGAYYGGSAWNESSATAKTTSALNEASQVQMSASLAVISDTTAAAIVIADDLPAGYTSATGWSFLTVNTATKTFTDTDCFTTNGPVQCVANVADADVTVTF